jgi:hypothetical protein
MQDQIEETSSIILKSCELLEKDTIFRLDQIIKEKSDARKKLNDDKKKHDLNLKSVCSF